MLLNVLGFLWDSIGFLCRAVFVSAGVLGWVIAIALPAVALPNLWRVLGILWGVFVVWVIVALSEYGFWFLVIVGLGISWCLQFLADLPDGSSATAPGKGKRKRKRKGRVDWLERWATLHSAADGTARWRRPRLRRGRFGLRPNPVRCAVCTRRPCVCNGRRNFRGGEGSGRRPAGF